jgi:hypothetical protein
VTDDFYEKLGIVVSQPRLATKTDHAWHGMMSGDVYEVVDTLCLDGEIKPLLTIELRVINEGR